MEKPLIKKQTAEENIRSHNLMWPHSAGYKAGTEHAKVERNGADQRETSEDP